MFRKPTVILNQMYGMILLLFYYYFSVADLPIYYHCLQGIQFHNFKCVRYAFPNLLQF